MLQELERRLTAVVAAAVEDRPHLTVAVDAAVPSPAAGAAVAAVSVVSAVPDPRFDPDRVAFATGDGGTVTGRRVLPLRFAARVAFALRPAPGADGGAAGRALLLEDVSIVGHALDEPSIRSGAAFRTADDAGFEVHALDLAAVAVDPLGDRGDDGTGPDGLLHGSLGYDGRATVWPPGSEGPQGVTRAVDVTVASTPVGVAVDDAVVATGGSTRVRVRGVGGSRLVELGVAGGEPSREPLRLAFAVVSDLPPAQRGRIVGGDAGTASGTRVVAVGTPETSVTYAAPSGDVGATRFELVEVRLASREGGPGLLLGSVAVGLVRVP